MDEIKAVVYDGSSVTSPKNWNNPKFGDPCYSLHTDSRNYVVIAIEDNLIERNTVNALRSQETDVESGVEVQMDDVIVFIPYGSRLGAHVGGPASTMANIDYKFPQCVCFAWANSGKAGLSDDENTSPTIKSSRNGEPAVIVLNDQGGGNVPIVLMTIANTNRNAAILDDGTVPSLLGTRGQHGEVPIVLMGNKDD